VKAALIALLATGCTTMRPEAKSTQLEIDITTPADPGDINNRLAASALNVTVDVKAFDENGNPEDGVGADADYNETLDVYVHFLGTLSPYLGGTPLKTIQMVHGVAMNQSMTLPPVFGPTTLWFDDDGATDPTFAGGTSATLWYRDPFTGDCQRPASESAIDALSNEPLNGKNVTINSSQYGANGRLVVTSVFAQGYTVADVQCMDANGTPPCHSTNEVGNGTGSGSAADYGYGYMDVFSYSAPTDAQDRFIVEGQLIDGYAGGVSEFDGLTELGFPQTFVNEDTVDVNPAREPKPVLFDTSWFTNKIQFERAESAAIEVDNTVVCALDSDYTTYKQWKLDPSGAGTPTACAGANIINVITAGTLDLDPGTLVGKTVTKIVGILRPVNIGSFNVWLIYPRTMADITTN